MIASAQLQKSFPQTLTAPERDFGQRFFAQIDADDLAALPPAQVGAIIKDQFKLCARKRFETKMSFSTNDKKGMAWAARRTYLNIVTDDLAFLVDSVAAYLAEKRLMVDLLLRPRLSISYTDKGQAALDPRGHAQQAHLHIVLHGTLNKIQQSDIRDGLLGVIKDVQDATRDWQAMRLRAIEAKQYILQAPRKKFANAELDEYVELLDYLYDNNFTFLGCRTYVFTTKGTQVESKIVKGSGLGLLADDRAPAYMSETGEPLPPPYQKQRIKMPPLYISKVNRTSTVHRRVPLDAVAVHHYDEDGNVTGETLFIGLFTSVTYSRSLRSIPLLKFKSDAVIKQSGFEPASHDGRALRHILEKYPRDELFQITVPELQATCASILRLQERQRIALYCRRDLFGRYVSCLIYIPRDRFDTHLRLKFQTILESELGGVCINYNSSVDDSPLVRILLTIATKQGDQKSFNTEKIERLLQDAGRVWGDSLADTLHQVIPDDARAERLISAYSDAFSPDYREHYDLAEAVRDIEKIESCLTRNDLEIDLRQEKMQLALKLYTPDRALVLSDILPILENMGVRVVTEHPFTVHPRGAKTDVVVQDMLLTTTTPFDIPSLKPVFEQAFVGIHAGTYENDGLNALIVTAGLTARDVEILRTYVRYLRQGSLPFSLGYIEQAVVAFPDLAARAVQLFKTLFDPAIKTRTTTTFDRAIQTALDRVTSLDHDRVWQAVLSSIRATLRTNAFQLGADKRVKPYISVKLDSRTLDFLPNPKPYREIFVYSNRMEGVHLRNGRIARGGIRWSDRAEDFRTEVLGLMKAQTVKNAVIVPSGAKGGFVVKHPPKTNDRKAVQAEGIACYQTLIRGLLDITDNYGKGGKIIKPKSVVCRDGDDPYLVVAADKGTATFSDIANALSIEYGFWMHDAFASGGSAGYDHKAMGITARGAWESVKRHFREVGHNTQTQLFDVMGVGDMAGDVFGNGMLLSPYIRLIGAFNHVHIFCDPTPDPKTSFAERERLFKNMLGWDHYNTKLLSKGGRVYNRSDKVLDLTPEIQKRFDLHKARVSPPELMSAMLKSSVDLMYLGGIGTYIKATSESHADASDKNNDAIRINAPQLRAHVVGEGANLGFTQRARIEAGECGIRLNADFIDNSAGVDTSDHEVNIKILLSTVMNNAPDRLSITARDKLLKSMTDDVAKLVLQDNYQQTQAISLLQMNAPALLPAHQAFMQDLERLGVLDRGIEFLPNDETITKRLASGQGLTRPELGILLSYAKLQLREKLLATDIPDQAELQGHLIAYFPQALQQKFRADILKHPLRREIVATWVSNTMVNRLGPTFTQNMAATRNVDVATIARAFIAVLSMMRFEDHWDAIEDLDGQVDAQTQLHAFYELGLLLGRLIDWMVMDHGDRLQIAETLRTWAEPLASYVGLFGTDKTTKSLLTDAQIATWSNRVAQWEDLQIPPPLAMILAARTKLAQAPSVLALHHAFKLPLTTTAQTYLHLAETFGLSWIRGQMDKMPRGNRWAATARAAMEQKLDQVQYQIAHAILSQKPASKGNATEKWMAAHESRVADITNMIGDIKRTGLSDLSIVMVLVQKIESMIQEK